MIGWRKGFAQPDVLTLDIDFGGCTFKASGTAAYVSAAFAIWLQQLQAADQEQSHAQPLPAFRGQKVGSC